MSSQRQQFDVLWTELNKPIKELRAAVLSLQTQAARAEVAGAVPVGDSLPTVGKPGRLFYVAGDGLYVDKGATWEKITA